jgi:hypothetical protein
MRNHPLVHRQSAPPATPTQFHFPPTHSTTGYHPDLATNPHDFTSTSSATYSLSSSCTRQFIPHRTSSSEGGTNTLPHPAQPPSNSSEGGPDCHFNSSKTHHLGTISHWWYCTNRHLPDRDDQPWSASPPGHHSPESLGR